MQKYVQSEYKSKDIFDNIAPSYDFLNHILSFSIDRLWNKVLIREILKDNHEVLQIQDKKNNQKECAESSRNNFILDLAAGTLNISLELKKKCQNKILSLDISQNMLKQGQSKLSLPEKQQIFPCVADAAALPLANNVCLISIVAFGIRNFNPRTVSLQELYRITSDYGKIYILELGHEQPFFCKYFYKIYLKYILPVLAYIFSGNYKAYTYLADSVLSFPKPEKFAKELKEVGFTDIYIKNLSFGIANLFVAKKRHPD